MSIISICTPNIGAPKCTKQMLTTMKREIDNTVVGNSSINFQQWIDNSGRTSTRKHKILTIFIPNSPKKHRQKILIAEYIFLSSTHEMFFRLII